MAETDWSLESNFKENGRFLDHQFFVVYVAKFLEESRGLKTGRRHRYMFISCPKNGSRRIHCKG
jgi:hypothetical protein